MQQSFIQRSILIIISIMAAFNSYAQEPDPIILKLLPEIPANITEPAQRAEFLTLHFWDNYNFSDTSFLMKEHLLERSFVDYIDLLSAVPDNTRDKSINSLMKKSESEPIIFSYILNLSEKYLYNTDSPICDEEKLIPFLQYALQASVLDDAEKIRPDFLLESISKNRRGHVANDIAYTLKNGGTGNLHSINTNYTLLYFNDPECEDCIELIKQLSASPLTNDLIKQGKLKILTVYINDDIEAWEKHSSDIPNSWIYSYDAEQKIMFEGTYNIKQFPTMYLLDKEKKVLLKDTTLEKLENYLREF